MERPVASGWSHGPPPDVGLIHDFKSDPNGLLSPPFIVGHEASGWVEEVGEGVKGFEKGEAYLVHGPIGCGACKACWDSSGSRSSGRSRAPRSSRPT